VTESLNINEMMVAVFGVLLISVVWTDVRTHRISNAMVVAILLLGLVSHLLAGGYAGIIDWLAGMAVGLAFFLPFYIAGGMGAGDVKLLAAVGSVLGPLAALFAGGIALLAGVPLALYQLMKRHYQISAQVRAGEADNTGHAQQHSNITADIWSPVGKHRLPYAAAVATGAFGGLWQSGQLAAFIGALS
jgi:prepilin peptidase CpaA